MRYDRILLATFGCVWTVFSGTIAEAQDVTYAPERGIGVADRARPDYDPIGYNLSGVRLYPAVDVSAVYNDNFRATATDRVSDVFAIVRPNVRGITEWSRHSVELNAFFEQPLHAKLSQENVGRYGGSALGQYDISRETSVQIIVNGQHGVESRTDINSFIGSENPVEFDSTDISLSGSHAAGDFRVDLAGGASRRSYQDTRSASGQIIDQSFRDVRSFYGSTSVSYRVGPGVSAVVSGQVDKNDYDVGPGSPAFNPLFSVDRESTGYTIQGGVDVELSSLIFGTVQVGLLRRLYRDPRLNDFSGPSISVQLLWNVTPLTTVRFNATRTVEDTASIDFAGNLRTRFAAIVDHELFRYVVLTGDVVYSHIKPNGPLASSDELAFGVAGRYLIDRHLSILANARHMQRTSNLSLFRFQQNTISVTARYTF